MKFKTLLFDLDGTLIDSRADLASAVNHALKEVGQPEQPEAMITPRVGNGLRVLLNEVMGIPTNEMLEKAIDSFSSYYSEHLVDETRLYDGVLECFQQFYGKVSIGVVTNKPKVFAVKIINKLGLSELVKTVVGGGDADSERKPHPGPILKALTEMQVEADSALVVGDGFQDITAGKAAGLKTCLARYGYGFRPDLLKLEPNFIINRFNELKEIVL